MARFKWKLLVGKHAEGSIRTNNYHLYRADDVIETDKNLGAIFDPKEPGFRKKFELIEDKGVGSESKPKPNPSGSDPTAVASAAEAGYRTIDETQSKPNLPQKGDPYPTAEAPKVVDFEDTFAGMSVAELKKFAESEEIELGGASRKEDILKAIRASLATA